MDPTDPRIERSVNRILQERFPEMAAALSKLADLLSEPVPDEGDGREDWVAWREETRVALIETVQRLLELIVATSGLCDACKDRIRQAGESMVAEVIAGAES